MTAQPESAFHLLAPGDSVSNEWDAGHTHDFGVGGDFDLSLAVDRLHFAESNSTNIAGSMAITNPTPLRAVLDGGMATKARRERHALSRRLNVQSSCNGAHRDQLKEAITDHCKNLALGAQRAAQNGHDALLQKFFKPANNVVDSTRKYVAQIFGQVAGICSSMTSGAAFKCEPYPDVCKNGVIAFKWRTDAATGDFINVCPSFWNYGQSTGCGGYSQANIIIHEVTHLLGTADKSYGCDSVPKLSYNDALNNADTYRCYANGESS